MPDAVDELEKVGLEKGAAVSLVPLTEYVGKIVKVTDDSMILDATRNISIRIAPDVLRSKKLLRKGERVGILALDDGSIRVRRLPIAGSIFDSIGS